MHDLYQTYEQNVSQIGKVYKRSKGREYLLLPISHIAQDAQIEVTVDEAGNFYQAKVVDKEDSPTTIPCTEASSSRTSKPVPHPLHDKLIYVAGDFVKYVGDIQNESSYDDYINQLSQWVNSPYSHRRVEAIYIYLKKGCLIKDLVDASIIILDNENKMIPKWTAQIAKEYGEKPALFKVINDTQEKVFVRFNTYKPGTVTTKVWEDSDIFDAFIKYNERNLLGKDLCYITGEKKQQADKHLNGLRRPGDKAKLISANDTSGYTYRGRFSKANEVASISYDVSQKAHHALKWLVSKQGKTIDERVFLVWGNKETEIISPQEDVLTYFEQIGVDVSEDHYTNTHAMYAEQFNKAIDGYKSSLSYNSKVIILVLDSATTGRLAVLYYQQLDTKEYLERIKNWHQTCTWRHFYKKNNEDKFIEFYGAPATKDIALAAYGARASDKLIKEAMARLLPCIVAGQKVPIDIVRSAFYRASRPVSMEKWEWEKTLSIACALLNKHYEKEGYSVSLDVTNKNRDYLFGRLLAVADVLERSGLDAEEKRATNAIRYMNAFAMHPARTWKIIQANIQPYQVKLGTKATYYCKLLDEIASEIDYEDFNDKPLSGVFLLGFYCQRHDLYKGKKEKDSESINLTEDDNNENPRS